MNNYIKENHPDIGWHSLLDKLYNIDLELRAIAAYGQVQSIERHNGMLKIVFGVVQEGHSMHDIQEAIAYRFERLSARMCETCGKFGLRRTELQEVRTLCTEHYALAFSEEHPVPSLMANQEPQKD